MSEAFEAWYLQFDISDGGNLLCKESSQRAWQAASQHYEAKLAEMQAELNKARELLSEARDDVVTQLDNYKELLPYKQHRYDAQKDTLDRIEDFLAKDK